MTLTAATILVIGPPGAGKTTAVENANLLRSQHGFTPFVTMDLNVVVREMGRRLEPALRDADISTIREALRRISGTAGDATFVEFGRACAEVFRALLPTEFPLVVDVGTGFIDESLFDKWMEVCPTIAIIGSPRECFDRRQVRGGAPNETFEDYETREFDAKFQSRWNRAEQV